MGAVAFLPLIVFLVCYVGCGITFTLLGADEPFGKFPRHVALLAGCAVALLLNRGIGVQDKLNIMTTSMGNSGVMMIVGSSLQNIHPVDRYNQRFHDRSSCEIHPKSHPADGNPCLPPRAEADHLFPFVSFQNHISNNPFHVCRLLHQNCIFPSYAFLLVAKFSRFLYLFLLDMSMFFL